MRGAQLSYNAFCAFWAIATLFHLASRHEMDASLHKFLLACCAILLLHRPASVPRLLLLATGQIYDVAIAAPFFDNHWLFMALANATILHAFLLLSCKQKAFTVDRADFYHSFTPAIRIELLILYFFVVFHKLNTDFFLPEVSCGVAFYLKQTELFPFLQLPRSTSFKVAAIYFTFIIEAAIPLLLLFRKTRNVGIFLGMLFHFIIAVGGFFYNFSSMLYAMFFLFVPAHTAVNFRTYLNNLNISQYKNWLYKVTNLRFSLKVWVYTIVGASAISILALLSLFFRDGGDFFLIFWCLYSALLMTLFVILSRKRSGETAPDQNIFAPKHPMLFLWAMLTFLNGLSPYLGLKTQSSFSMYANLRTEGDRTNHFFIPASVQLFDLQKDLVEVIDSSGVTLGITRREVKRYARVTLQSMAAGDYLIPFLEFRALISKHPEASVSYIHKGIRRNVARVADDPEISQPVPFLPRKLLHFRPVSKTGPQACLH